MTSKTSSYKKLLFDKLKDPERACGILTSAFEDEDPRMGLLALRDVVEANGGITKISKLSKLSRVHLYEILSEKGNPEYKSLGAILKALGLNLAVGINPKARKRLQRKKSPATAS